MVLTSAILIDSKLGNPLWCWKRRASRSCVGHIRSQSRVPDFFNLRLSRAAIRARASMCDFGGNTEQVRQQLALDAEARAAGITLIPDCGLVIIRVIVRGLKDGQEKQATIDLFDHYDETTGFTAMERTTGWHAAIMAGPIARGQTPRGAIPVELAVPGPLFVEEFRKRGFDLRLS